MAGKRYSMVSRFRKNLFWQTGCKYGLKLLLYIMAALALNVIVIAGNEYIAQATDLLLSGEHIYFKQFFVPLTVMIVFGAIFTYIKSINGTNYSAAVQLDIKKRLGHHLLTLPYAYYDEKGTGSIMTKLISDINDAGRFFSEIMPDFIVDLITVITISIYLWQMDARLMLVLLITYPVLLVAADKLSRRLTSVIKKRKISLDARTQIAYDAIQGMEIVRSYNLEKVMQQKIDYYIDDVAEQGCTSTRITSLGHVLRHLVNTVPVVICYLFALHETLAGRMTSGDMLAFSVLLTRIVWPLGNIVFCVNDIREIQVSLKRLQEIYEQKSEESGEETYDIADAQGTVIAWENVCFSYDEERTVLKDISFYVKRGETIAFAGGSGEGKSTIFRLLCGFYRKKSGRFELFGHAYETWNIDAARECFSYVSQNVFLFPDTIGNNIAYGKTGATREEVIAACKNANIHEFIIGLPDGYDTVVGERGVKLSGGECQRISIARAFLKNAPILLLDEPTAAVDTSTEKKLQEAIARISAGKTVIIIAHRLSTIQNADRIYVVNQGKIAEVGRHEQLLAQNGIYAGMYGREVAASEH